MEDNKIRDLMDVSMEKIRSLVDANTVVGTPITFGSVMLVPVCRINVGLATGGSGLPNQKGQDLFCGGLGAGVTVTPGAFISIVDKSVRVLPISGNSTGLDRAIAAAPELLDSIKKTFSKNSEE